MYSHGFAKHVVTVPLPSMDFSTFVYILLNWPLLYCIIVEKFGNVMVFSWCFVGNSWGDYFTHKYPLSRAYLGISHGGTLVGMHPTIH